MTYTANADGGGVFGSLYDPDQIAFKGPMKLEDIHSAVMDSGYKTSSKNFKNVIYQNLYNKDEFVKSGDGWTYNG